MTYRKPCDPDDLNPSNHKGCLADAAEREHKRGQETIRLSVLFVCVAVVLMSLFTANCNSQQAVTDATRWRERALHCEAAE